MKKNKLLLNSSFFYNLFLIFTLFLSIKNFSQRDHILPYSSFGVGDMKFDSDVVLNSMGKISSCVPNELENNQINFSNPAANKHSTYTTFNISGNTDLYYFKNQKTFLENNNTTFSNLSISLPISKKFFFGLGFQPYTKFQYDKLNEEMGYYKKSLFLCYGDSGVNSLHTVLSYHVTDNLNIGLRLNYLFGNFNKILEFSDHKDTSIVIRNNREYFFNGFNFTPGIYYSLPLRNGKYKLNAGFTLTSDKYFKTGVTFSRLKYFYLTDGYGKKVKSDDIFLLKYSDNNLITYLPFSYSFGLSLQKNKNWMLGLEFSNRQLSKFFLPQDSILYKIILPKYSTVYKNQFRISLGGYIIPNNNNKYLSRIIYRFGTYYENTGLLIANNVIHQFGITFGVGLPIGVNKKNPSKLNIGFEIGKIGKIKYPIQEELFLKINVGLDLSEIWNSKILSN